MTKGQQIKSKTRLIEKRNHDAPFGLISSSIFTSKTLARLKYQQNKLNNSCLDQEEILFFKKKFI
jgi:hypothetical protein